MSLQGGRKRSIHHTIFQDGPVTSVGRFKEIDDPTHSSETSRRCSSCWHIRQSDEYYRSVNTCRYCASKYIPKSTPREQLVDIIMEICSTINELKYSYEFSGMDSKKKREALERLRVNRSKYTIALNGSPNSKISLDKKVISEIEKREDSTTDLEREVQNFHLKKHGFYFNE